MTRRGVNYTDLTSGVVVTVLGGAALVESLRMPRFEARGADPFTVPGLTPGLLSAVLCLLGVVLLLRGLRGRLPASGAGAGITDWSGGSARRTLFTVAMVVIYGVLLFGRVPFVPATALFVFVFTLGAELINPQRRLSLPATAAGAAVLALGGAFAIHYVFTQLFLVRLPG